MDILIDFDGTVVTHKYPKIGNEIDNCVKTLKRLIDSGHNLILFTMRDDIELQDAIQWFKSKNIPLYGINKNPTQHIWTTSSKAYGTLIIDDICLGIPLLYDNDSQRDFVDWNKVEKMLEEMRLI